MEINFVSDEHGGAHIIMTTPDVERVNPIKFYSDWFITRDRILFSDLLKRKGFQLSYDIQNRVALKKAKEHWDIKYSEIIKTEIPASLKAVLKVQKKKIQVQLLKGLSITPEIILAFIFHAWSEYGYTFSQYKSEHQRPGLDKGELPSVVHVDGDQVKRAGRKSTLTDGQLKQAIEQRTVVIAKFLDKDENWHCLFATYNSLRGEENWKSGQPHFHYISSDFGLSREEVVESLRSRHYKLGSLPHISLIDYENDTPTPTDHQ